MDFTIILHKTVSFIIILCKKLNLDFKKVYNKNYKNLFKANKTKQPSIIETKYKVPAERNVKYKIWSRLEETKTKAQKHKILKHMYEIL